jgi:segregation and condensation protein B
MSTTTNPPDDLAVQADAPSGPALPQDAANGGAGDPVHANGNGDDRTAVLEERELKALLEALLFVSHEPVSIDRLMAAVGHTSPAEVRPALRHLGEDFDREGRGLQLVEVAGGFQLVTRPDYAPWIKRLDRARSVPKLSRSALESLAIIAYKQPIVRTDIEQIRGVETSSVLRTLLERKLVRMVGRKDSPGRPILYGTTKTFLQHFGLRDLSELPPLREFTELGESEQASLPVEEDPASSLP